MTSCLVKPALYIVQKTGPRVKLSEPCHALEEAECDPEEDTGDTNIVGNLRILNKKLCFYINYFSLALNTQQTSLTLFKNPKKILLYRKLHFKFDFVTEIETAAVHIMVMSFQ